MNAEATRSLILAILHKHEFSIETKRELVEVSSISRVQQFVPMGKEITLITPKSESALREDLESMSQDTAFAILLYDHERDTNSSIKILTDYLKKRIIDHMDDIRLLSSLSIVTDSPSIRQYVLDRMKYLSQHIPEVESLEAL